ncbi:MAG TPA: hypothetical protein VF628_02220 [Allosphingosinicella sp.]|jgi:hypothetical protein
MGRGVDLGGLVLVAIGIVALLLLFAAVARATERAFANMLGEDTSPPIDAESELRRLRERGGL